MRRQISSIVLGPSVLLALAAAIASCSGGNAASGLAAAPAYEPKDQSKCGVTKSQARPLIVEWPSADRVALEAQLRDSLVAVRYEGCEMEVLRQCRVKGSYRFVGTTKQDDRVAIKDADDLYAAIPAHAAKFESKLEKSGQLTVSMSMVGTFEADRTMVRIEELEGECAGATHVVTAATAGAFEFFAGADAEVMAGAAVGGLGGGARSAHSHETLNRAGDAQACTNAKPEDARPPFGCGAVLRVEVAAILGASGTKGTRCEIVMPAEGCPRQAGISGTFSDDWEGSGSDQARCLRRAKEWWSHCGSSQAVVARFLKGDKLVREERVESPSRCQITVPICPRNAKIAGVFNDDHEYASSDPARCMKRGAEWHSWCGASHPVTARFYQGATVTKEQRIEPPTRCQLTIPKCPRNPEIAGIFNDDAEGSGTDEARCLRRASEWYSWCAAPDSVTARFFKGTEVAREERSESPTRCEISVTSCPRKAAMIGMFNDTADNAGADEARCMRRASDWYSWCGGAEAVTARFYQKATVSKEVRALTPTRCQITIPECPKDSALVGVFNDDADGSGSNEARCMQRAAEWRGWCGTAKPVTARFFKGTAQLKEQVAGP